eukprot:GHVT01065200.1.p1 GENE.GHVT01065200.1~~GHVT01065200.1.p1  ORF type:complete len:120 (+),score=27.72 GHVT01065200.1:1035-1394(+)
MVTNRLELPRGFPAFRAPTIPSAQPANFNRQEERQARRGSFSNLPQAARALTFRAARAAVPRGASGRCLRPWPSEIFPREENNRPPPPTAFSRGLGKEKNGKRGLWNEAVATHHPKAGL